MKLIKHILILSSTLLLSANIFGQAAVDIQLSATDGTDLVFLAVGLDLTATDCIDEQLGEYEIPPIPPTGLFDIRLELNSSDCYGVTTFKDYRAPGNPPAFPFSGMIEHILWWQTTAPALPIDITYNLPPGTIMIITDQLGGIFLNIGPLMGQGIAIIPGFYTNIFSKALLKMYYNNIGGNPTPGPVFSLVPNSLNFGEVPFGETMTEPVWISNLGYLDSLFIYNAVSSNPSFTFEPNSFPLILAPGQTQMFEITYSGITGGTHIDSILFFHNAPDSPSCLNVRSQTFEPNQNCGAQRFWDVIVSDGVDPFVRYLVFGLDSTATDGIDPQLGENGPLPPFPPPEVFEAQLFLPENNFSGTLSSYCDFRYAVFPFTEQKEWRLAYQPGTGNTINISWDFPSYMTGVLLDIINGMFINVPMIDSGSYTVQDPYTFNKLRMIIDFNITSPVELISFNATLLDNNVKLDWVTTTETNNSGFEIQKTSPFPSPYQGEGGEAGRGWEVIGFVPGFGTTTEPKSYSFIDENVTTGTYKYRLKQIDFDGSFAYSNEIEVEVDFTPEEFELYQNYPNPFNPKTVISYQLPVSGNVTLKVYDILGNEVATLVNEEKQPGVYEVEFSVGQDSSPDRASGIYFYQLRSGDFVSVKKMLLLK
jgi:hypothetical protein